MRSRVEKERRTDARTFPRAELRRSDWAAFPFERVIAKVGAFFPDRVMMIMIRGRMINNKGETDARSGEAHTGVCLYAKVSLILMSP